MNDYMVKYRIGGCERETLYGLEAGSNVEQQFFILIKLLIYIHIKVILIPYDTQTINKL